MKKISTLYKKDPNDLSKVINEVNPENEWVFTDLGVIATRKYDGTACAVINGLLYRRYDVKKGKQVPANAIPCQDPDPVTGHWPHWLLCDQDNSGDKFHFEAFLHNEILEDGTYELCGPKVQGNPEGLTAHCLIKHKGTWLNLGAAKLDFYGFKDYLAENDIEGIVFHHPDGRMCKLRKSDFGFKRIKYLVDLHQDCLSKCSGKFTCIDECLKFKSEKIGTHVDCLRLGECQHTAAPVCENGCVLFKPQTISK